MPVVPWRWRPSQTLFWSTKKLKKDFIVTLKTATSGPSPPLTWSSTRSQFMRELNTSATCVTGATTSLVTVAKIYTIWQNSFYTMHVRRFEETQEDNSWGFPLSMSLLWLLGQSNPDSQEPHQQTPFTFVKCKVIMIFTIYCIKILRVKMFHLYLLHSKL